MKKLLATLFLAFVVLFSPMPALAQGDDGYVLLAPLPGLDVDDIESSDNPLGEYLKIVYRLGVSLAILFAVVALIFGGVQYMTSDSVTTKGSAKDTITAALVGLLLAVASYVLLFLIGGAGTVTISSDFGSLPWIEPPPQSEDSDDSVRVDDEDPPEGGGGR
ncbi:MAG: hypothetical protein U5L75_03135 [Candidatus Campbellbacteria bacterium]|nr:hypothetical protein [Candidatus Campbellbacteria bacterium]